MKLAILALALCLGASAQTTTPCPVPYDGKTPCITTYPTAPGVITLTVGTLQCTLWSQSPTAGQVQAACCNTTCAGAYSGPLVLNTISTISGQGDAVGGFTIPTVGWVLWLLSPGATAPGITYQVAVGPPGTLATPIIVGAAAPSMLQGTF